MRKIGFLFLGVTVVGVLCFVVIRTYLQSASQGKTRVDKLSTRSQEFITHESGSGTGLWSEVTLDSDSSSESGVFAAGSAIETPCFTLVLSAKTNNHKQENEKKSCLLRARSLEPRGTLVIQASNDEKFQENTGIMIRRNDPSTYTEHSVTSTSWQESALFTDKNSIVIYGGKTPWVVSIALSNLADTSEEKIQTVIKMLESLEFKE